MAQTREACRLQDRYRARPKPPGRSGSPATWVAPSRFVLVDLGHGDLRCAVARPHADVTVAGAVGVVALVLHASGRGLPRQLLEEGHAARRFVLVAHYSPASLSGTSYVVSCSTPAQGRSSGLGGWRIASGSRCCQGHAWPMK